MSSLLKWVGSIFLVTFIVNIIIKLCNFYNISSSVYGAYLAFYIFIFAACVVLPTQIPE